MDKAGFDTRGFGKGFHIKFANGYTVSVQWGFGTYSDNHDREKANNDSNTAEIAAWDRNDVWYLPEQVEGYCTPERVAEFIAEVSKL